MISEKLSNKLVISRYSYFFTTSKGAFLAYSSKTNSFLEISEDLFALLKQALCSTDKSVPNGIPVEIVKLLQEEGFICNVNDDDEFVSKYQFITQSIQHNTSKLGLVIVPTLNCNFNCPYCFESFKQAKYMDDMVEKELIDFIKSHGKAEMITLTWYGGEPLLALNRIESILDNIATSIPLKINEHTLITNGYLFNDKAIKLFQKYPLDTIQITLDGVKNRHNKLRALKYNNSVSTYDIILKNIESIVEKLPSTQLHIRVNIDKDNQNDYFRVYEDLHSLVNFDNITIYPGMIRLENKEKTCLVNPAFERWESANFIYNLNEKGYLKGDIYPRRRMAKTCCASCVSSYIVGPSGEIYKCWNDVSDKDKIIGYINEEKISNPTLYYRYHQGCAWYNDIECKTCFFMPICNGKCAWYNERNIYHSGKYNLCQCFQKAPGLLDKSLEQYYEQKSQRLTVQSIV